MQANKDTVVEVWLPPADKELAKLTKMGYKTILAQPWYLDYIGYGQDWKNYYKYEPLNFNGLFLENKVLMVYFENTSHSILMVCKSLQYKPLIFNGL